VNFADMFRECLSREGDAWEAITPLNGDPIPASTDGYAGIVLTGSRFNVRDNLEWFEPVCHLIRMAAERGSPRVYGGCFGCQLVGHALGGRVDKNPSLRFVLKAETMNVDGAMLAKVCRQDESIACPSSFRLIESHGDCVRELPPGAILIGRSETCCHEMYAAGKELNILACQAHPEFELQYCILDRILPAVTKANRIDENERVVALQSFETFVDDDSRKMIALISDFLHL
jgi:GMP synthase (glutamine-hydrolysing)